VRKRCAALKPQEVRALTLKAEGFSYAEIGRDHGLELYDDQRECGGHVRVGEMASESMHGDLPPVALPVSVRASRPTLSPDK